MKKQIILLTILVILIISIFGYLIYYQLNKNQNPVVGGDKDEHGCIGSAGYSWCESKQKCLRIWEEICNPEDCKNYTIDKCPTGCVVCPSCETCSSITCNSKEFCSSIGFNETWYTDINSMNSTKHYCTTEDRKDHPCPAIRTITCGWFKANLNCPKYPCALEYSNSCFACLDPKIDYYIEGECPK